MSAAIAACATASGGLCALIRISGPATVSLTAAAGLPRPDPWCWRTCHIPLALGALPARVGFAPAGRSATGADLIELVVPGSRACVDAVLQHLYQHGIRPAGPGAFSRMAVAHGTLTLDQAEAVLALATASDAAAAGWALRRLRQSLGDACEPLRCTLLDLVSAIEAGLDFAEEEDVRTYDPAVLRTALEHIQGVCRRWRRAAVAVGDLPEVVLVGPGNAGKSALFQALTGADVLIADGPGTTRDYLTAEWHGGGRPVRLVDSAGWMGTDDGVEQEAIARGRRRCQAAELILVCSAADARAPEPLPAWLPLERCVVLATKADRPEPVDPRAAVAVSARTGVGLAAVEGVLVDRLGGAGGGDRRQQEILAVVAQRCACLLDAPWPEDVLLAEEIRALIDLLGDLIGVCTPEEVLDRIFSRFCIGK